MGCINTMSLMKVALMQPYFFPYLGYFQLVGAVDRFIVYDDVQYMKGGWINRNRILMQNKPAWISLPVSPDSVSSKIYERRISRKEHEKSRIKIMGQLHAAYRKAPHYAATRQLVEVILAFEESSLSLFLFNGLQITCTHLGIETPLVLSSDIQKDDEGLSGADRVIAICKAMQADMYVNAIGGRELYSADDFLAANMDLRFISMEPITYSQGSEEFVPHLSIIDVMMFNEPAVIRQYLQQYTLGT